ncbi:ABC transporter permease [Bdellovibrio sp.]|uniref:ABC transporter permease n=1 Tax=Bdellovibrio sp. TaxID=28201 RepID=UPI0039E5A0EF
MISSYVETNLRLRYRRSFVGFLWTIIAPLLQYMIIAYVFKYASRITDHNYFAYFFTGAVVFNAFSVTLLRAPNIMLANEMYIKKIYLPKSIYVLNTCLYELTNFFFTGITLFALGLLLGIISPSAALLTVPLAIILLFITLLGASAILAIGGVYFRDLSYIMPPIMQASFFLTPIIYRLETFPEKIQKLINFNPFYHIIETIRIPITQGVLAPNEHYAVSFFTSLATIGVGYWMIKHFDNRIIFKL